MTQKRKRMPSPDQDLRDIGKKANGTTASNVVRKILGAIIQQVGTTLTALSIDNAGENIQRGLEATTDSRKRLFK